MWEDPFSLATIGVLLTLFFGFIAIGVGIMNPPIWVAKICFSFAAIIVAGWLGWVLLKYTNQSIPVIRYGLPLLIFGLIGIGWIESFRLVDHRYEMIIKRQEQQELRQLFGVLIPDNKPTPTEPCSNIPPKMIAMMCGNCVTYTGHLPHIVLRVGDKDLLIINKEQNRIIVSGRFYSSDGRIVAELKDNYFAINPNNYFRIERPDHHRLVVYDQKGDQILNIEYINAMFIKLLGTFYVPNHDPVIFDENGIHIGTINYSGMCLGYAGNISIHAR
jgi:hypothetical protein